MFIRLTLVLLLLALPALAQQLPPAYQNLIESYQMMVGQRDYEIESLRRGLQDYDARLKFVLDNWVPKQVAK